MFVGNQQVLTSRARHLRRLPWWDVTEADLRHLLSCNAPPCAQPSRLLRSAHQRHGWLLPQDPREIHPRHAASLYLFAAWDDPLGEGHLWGHSATRVVVRWRTRSSLRSRSAPAFPRSSCPRGWESLVRKPLMFLDAGKTLCFKSYIGQ